MQLRLILGCVAALTSSEAMSAEPVMLAPSARWSVNYAADSCSLTRIFGEGDKSAILMIDRFQPSDSFQLTLASKLLTRNYPSLPGSRRVAFRFGPGEAEQSPETATGSFEELPAVIVRHLLLGEVPDEAAHAAAVAKATSQDDKKLLRALKNQTIPAPVTPEREAAVNFLEIRGFSRDPIILGTGSMAKPMAALRSCTDDLLAGWGIDIEAHKSLSRTATPIGSPAEWVLPGDYPEHLEFKGAQTLIHFRLMIDEQGRVSACHIQQSAGEAEFDAVVCKIMTTRARFEPALDAGGKPIKSYWLSKFSFISLPSH